MYPVKFQTQGRLVIENPIYIAGQRIQEPSTRCTLVVIKKKN